MVSRSTNIICFIILSIGLSNCNNKPDEEPFCSDCSFKSDEQAGTNTMEGSLVWLEKDNRYGIQTLTNHERHVFLPCEFPSYFQPEEMSPVKLSGKISEFQYSEGQIIPTAFNCIKLDTIFTPQIVSPEITGRWEWIMSYLPGQFIEETPQSTGRQEILEFGPFLTRAKFKNDTLTEFGAFSTGHRTYANPNYPATVYSFDSIVYKGNGNILIHEYFKISHDTLRFSSLFAGYYGGGSVFYKRIKSFHQPY